MTYDNADYEENVVNLIERPAKEYIKSPRYRSIHSKRTRLEVARSKSAHKTLGPPKTPLNPPTDYLKKNSRITAKIPENRHTHYRRPGYIHQLPAWEPTKRPRAISAEARLQELPRDPAIIGRLNFRKRNIEYATKLKPKKPKPRCVHTRRGDVQDLKAHGLMPVFVHKKTYGEVPEMLKNQWIPPSKESDKRSTPQNPAMKKSACKYITEDERAKLLKDMKKTLAELMKQFQCLPFLIDTPPKIKRKTKMEETIRQLEKDIELIENHQYLYVYDD